MSTEREPAVEGGVPRYTSVSALQRLRRCNTSWYYRYVLRRPDPAGPGAELGTKCHAELEHYFTTGENVLGDIARRGMHLLPKPGPHHRAEVPFTTESGFHLDVDGIPMKGFIDRVDEHHRHILGLVDYKFKKDIVKYGTTPEKLADLRSDDGLQMGAYAAAACNAQKDGAIPASYELVRLEHNHFSTGKPVPAARIYADVPLDDRLAVWREIAEPLGQKLRKVAAAPGPEHVDGPADKAACFAYGGCPFRKECPHFNSSKPADKRARLSQLLSLSAPLNTGGEQMGMLTRMKTPETVAPAGPPPPTGAALEYVTAVQNNDAAAKAAALEKMAVEENASARKQAGINATMSVTVPVAAVLPPDAPTPTKPVPFIHDEVATPEEHIAQHAVLPLNGPLNATPVPAAQADSKSATPAPEAPAEKKSRGRKKAEPKTTIELPLEKGPDGLLRRTDVAPATEGFTLYLRGAPTKKAPALFKNYVDGLEGLLLEKFRTELGIDISDARMSEGPVIGYGKWKIVLQELAKENPPAAGGYVVNLGTDERVDAVFGVLEDLAAEVVR